MSQTDSLDARHWQVGIPGLAPESQQAQLVILFTDIADSTKLSDRMPGGDYHALLLDHNAILTEIITRDAAGTCVKHTGDGFLAVFRLADVAVQCALDMQRAMRDHKLSIRIGINAGQVRVSRLDDGRFDVFGQTVNWAARVEALAEAGHICVTDRVHTDASQEFNSGVCSWKHHGKYVVKGAKKPLDIYEPHEDNGTPMAALRGTRLYGAHPKTWHVRIARNRNFTGREDILTKLYDSLHGNDRAALTQTDAIHGLGGIGKTQIAAEYAHRYAGNYQCVWWVSAEDASSRRTGYVALAQRLGLPEKDAQDQTVTVAAVREWLRLNDRWLLIFDNAPDADAVADLLPDGNSGHIVITSRSAAWLDIARPVEVVTWPREESVEFLRARTGIDEEDGADAVADELGDLPLALEQAAAYMHAAAMSYDEYLECYRVGPTEAMGTSAPRSHPDPVARTWEVSMARLREESPEAADLLNLCAFFAPDDIPRDMIAEGAEHLPEPLASAVGSSTAMGSITAALRLYSLMTVDSEALSVHRLVQQVVRDGMSNDGRQRCWEGAARVLAAAMPADVLTNPNVWPTSGRLLPHVRAVTDAEMGPGSAGDAAGALLNHGGVYLWIRAHFVEAAEMLRTAVQVGEAVAGPEHPEVAAYVNNLGSVLRDQADLSGAKACHERALRIDEDAYGPDHPNVARDVNSLGSVLADQGDLDGAKGCYERALRIDEDTYGPDHPNVANRVSNLGNVLRAQGDLPGAKECYERALRIDEDTHGLDHPTVAIRVNNLGGVLHDQGDLSGAKERYGRALRIEEDTYGPGHPNVAKLLCNLGTVLRHQGDLAGAKERHARALRIDEDIYGPDHPSVATDVSNLGGVLRDQGDLSGAKECYERALRIDEDTYGPSHPSVAIRVSNLGEVLRARGDLSGARACHERALRIDEDTYGPDHPNVAADVNNLGGVLQAQGDLPGATECFRRALRIDERTHGLDHPNVAIRVNNLGAVLFKQGDAQAALVCLQRAVRIQTQFLGTDHPRTVQAQQNVDIVLATIRG